MVKWLIGRLGFYKPDLLLPQGLEWKAGLKAQRMVKGGLPFDFAQTEQNDTVSDQELEKFATAYKQVQLIGQETQQKMSTAIENVGLEVQRFIEIQNSEQDPNQEIAAEGEELKKYELAKVELEKIQVNYQKVTQEKIVEAGLTIVRYQQIAVKLQGDPELQKKIQKFFEE